MTSDEKLGDSLKTEVEKESTFELDSSLSSEMDERYEIVKINSRSPTLHDIREFKANSKSPSLTAEADELRIMLVGARGSGKSSTGNTIIRWNAFNTDMQLSRVTQFCERATGNINGRPVVIVDTPGLNKTSRMEKEVTREILKSVSLYKPGPHVFLRVLPVGNLTNEDKDMHKLIQNMFGKSVWNYTIVLFTHGDRLEGKTPNDVIASSDKDLRDFIRTCTGGFVFFNNKNTGFEQVSKLLEKIDTLVAVNGGSCYTTSFYPASEKKIREKQEKILEERHEEIARKLRELEENCEGEEELERKKCELWREEDEDARRRAEKPQKSRSMTLNLSRTPASVTKS